MPHTPFSTSEAYAIERDRSDPLREFRAEFAIPPAHEIRRAAGGSGGEAKDQAGPCVYLTGNSLGAMPRAVPDLLRQETQDWARLGVEAHMSGRDPWLPYHEQFRGPLARLLGAHEHEVVAMNSLTVNLHLLMATFYRPSADRFQIIIEDSAFPSDRYALTSLARLHGLDPAKAIIGLKPREGESTLRTEDIAAAIDRVAPRLALVWLGAVNYLTGQWFDMPAITAAAHRVGAFAGWDLAHAAGNVPTRLHDCDADFAVWCSYKYLNAGPGAIAGAYAHERHCRNADLPQLAGWWGNDPATRFRMGPEFVPVATADRWAVSNPPIFSLTPLKASLALFDRAGITRLREKSLALTGYLERLVRELSPRVKQLTPTDPAARGCQLSLVVPGDARTINRELLKQGIVTDVREPDVIRAAPAPLYNTFHDVWTFAHALAQLTNG